MARLLFEKTGKAIWISHLDLMKVFQRAFQRAKLPLIHTNGFNQRPSVSIALPMSVGISSRCELLDFDLDRWEVALEDIPQLLNPVLISGVKVLDCYEKSRKIKEIAYLDYEILLHYDRCVTSIEKEKLTDLFHRESILVEKRNRNGVTQQDIIPLLRHFEIETDGDRTMKIRAVICCQNPALNPAQLISAIAQELPELKPDQISYHRLEVLDAQEKTFR